MKGEQGFTLIELLTIIGIIGVLASLALTSFALYRSSASYAAAAVVMHDARNAVEAALSDSDNLPPPVGMSSVTGPSAMPDALAQRLLPGMQVGKDVKLTYAYDPNCKDGACAYESYLQANHCRGTEFVRWVRFGDGLEVILEHVNGAGC